MSPTLASATGRWRQATSHPQLALTADSSARFAHLQDHAAPHAWPDTERALDAMKRLATWRDGGRRGVPNVKAP